VQNVVTIASKYLHHFLLWFNVVAHKEALHHFFGCLGMCGCMEGLGSISSRIPLEKVTAAWRLSSVNTLPFCKILGFLGGDYEECRLLGCYAMWLL
jgi:hypothetical protein